MWRGTGGGGNNQLSDHFPPPPSSALDHMGFHCSREGGVAMNALSFSL